MLALRVILLCLAVAGVSTNSELQSCLASRGSTKLVFEVLPGRGWDNLVNEERERVFDLKYKQCRVSEDAKYILPDDIALIPTKSAIVQRDAEVFTHWDNYTSATSKSINLGGGIGGAIGLGGLFDLSVQLSGKYSQEYTSVKSHQFSEKAITTRVQLRYLQYKARLDTERSYTKPFLDRLNRIAFFVAIGEDRVARYECQLLVRDYGTHVINSIDAGASLVKVDHVDKSFYEQSESDQSGSSVSVRASAGLSFLGLLKIGPQIHYGIDTSSSQAESSNSGYDSKVSSSEITTYGGPVYRPDMSVTDWSKDLENNIVALDRDGEPLSNFITQSALPKVPYNDVLKIQQMVSNAINLYYRRNTYSGCTDRDSPNFNFIANVDDGTCKPPTTTYKLGGVFQTCDGDEQLCADKLKHNPLTQDVSCPPNFNPNLIDDTTLYRFETQRVCRRCYWLFHCCNDQVNTYPAFVKTYWCSAIEKNVSENGYYLGGFFGHTGPNVLTKTNTCPPSFFSVTILDDLNICLSNDETLGVVSSLPFGGLFSCKTPNPFTNDYLCPKNFSQHMLDSVDDCDIYYCTQTSKISTQSLPNVKTLPFMKKPFPTHEQGGRNSEPLNVTFIISDDGSTWTSFDEANKTIPLLLKAQGVEFIMTKMSPTITNMSEIEEPEMRMMVPSKAIPKVECLCDNNQTTTKPTTTPAAVYRLDKDAIQPDAYNQEKQTDQGSPEDDHANLPLVIISTVFGTLAVTALVALVIVKVRGKKTSMYGEI